MNTKKMSGICLLLIILVITIMPYSSVYGEEKRTSLNDTETTGVFGANKDLKLNINHEETTARKNAQKTIKKKNETKKEKEEEYELNLYYVIETTGISGANNKVDLEKVKDIINKVDDN